MQEKSSKKKRPLNRYLILTSVPFRIGITIYLGVYLGESIDSRYTFEKPWFTILGVLLALIFAMYSVIQQLNRLNKQDEE